MCIINMSTTMSRSPVSHPDFWKKQTLLWVRLREVTKLSHGPYADTDSVYRIYRPQPPFLKYLQPRTAPRYP